MLHRQLQQHLMFDCDHRHRRDGEQDKSGEESYPASPFTRNSGSATPATQDVRTNGDQQRHAFTSEARAEAKAAAAVAAREEAAEAAAAGTPQLSRQPTLTAPGSAQGFGSAHSSVARSVSVSDAEDVSLGASEDRGDLQEVSQLAADPNVAPAAAAAAGGQGANVAAGGAAANGEGSPALVTPVTSDDSLAAEVARVLAAGGAANGTASRAARGLPPAHLQPGAAAGIMSNTVSATFAAARDAALAAAGAAEQQQQQRGSSKMVRRLVVAHM